MPNRKRWYAELAGTILLWAEEVPENPPWEAFILRRPRMMGFVESPGGELVKVQIPATRESFVARSEKIDDGRSRNNYSERSSVPGIRSPLWRDKVAVVRNLRRRLERALRPIRSGGRGVRQRGPGYHQPAV